jgi:hypothetical protein
MMMVMGFVGNMGEYEMMMRMIMMMGLVKDVGEYAMMIWVAVYGLSQQMTYTIQRQ